MFNNELDYPEEGTALGSGAVRADFRTFGTGGFSYAPSLSVTSRHTTAGYNAVHAKPVRIDRGPIFIPAHGQHLWVRRQIEKDKDFYPALGEYLDEIFPTVGMNAYAAFKAEKAHAEGRDHLQASYDALQEFTYLGVCEYVQPTDDLKNLRVTYWQQGFIGVMPLFENLTGKELLAQEDVGFVTLQREPVTAYIMGAENKLSSSGATSMAIDGTGATNAYEIYRPTLGLPIWQCVPAFIPRDYADEALRIGAFLMEPTYVPKFITDRAQTAYFKSALSKPPGSMDFEDTRIMFGLKTI